MQACGERSGGAGGVVGGFDEAGYVEALLAGVRRELPSGKTAAWIRAARYDAQAKQFEDVQIEVEGSAGHADRAEFVVDRAAGTVRLRLIGVVLVDASAGEVIEVAEFETEALPMATVGAGETPIRVPSVSEITVER